MQSRSIVLGLSCLVTVAAAVAVALLPMPMSEHSRTTSDRPSVSRALVMRSAVGLPPLSEQTVTRLEDGDRQQEEIRRVEGEIARVRLQAQIDNALSRKDPARP